MKTKRTSTLNISKLLLIGLCTIMSSVLYAQEDPKGLGIASDSTKSNYENYDIIGGPRSLGAQLNADNQSKESYFRVPTKVSKPWYDLKQKWNEDAGIRLGINYTSVFIGSNKVIDDDVNDNNAGGGILDIQFGWNLVNRKKGKNRGTLYARINSRHGYGSGTSPMFHGLNESGYFGLPATGFRSYTIRMNELHYTQHFFDDILAVIVGKVDPTNYFNYHPLLVPYTGFLGYGGSVSGTVNWPDKGVGALAGVKIGDKFSVVAALTDVRGDIYNDGEFLYFGENFFKGNFFTSAELGFSPSSAERLTKKISVTLWQTDSYVSAAGADIPMAQGIAVSSYWKFKDKFAPFLRFGFSNGKGENAFYKKDLQIGHGLHLRSHDVLGTGISIAEPNIPDAKNQVTAEVYYSFQLAEHLAITPDFQWIINPTLNPDVNSLIYIGLRGRITL